jgi:hypothetical protein
MRPEVALRLLALAALALVAAVVAVAVSRAGGNEGANTSALPDAAPAPDGGWYRALAAPAPTVTKPTQTACGARLDAKTLGIAHPVLPCNVKLYIEYDGRRVLTQVIDRGPQGGGREFELTKALADRIGLKGVALVQWRFAVEPED